MGLDMYLYKKNKAEEKFTEEVLQEMSYWRKDYATMNWFTMNLEDEVDNTKYSLVPKEKVEALLKATEEAVDTDTIPECFTEGPWNVVEDWFAEDSIETAKSLKETLRNTDFETEELYFWPWW